MNAKEKAKVLQANGYFYFSTGSAPQEPEKYRVYSWYFGARSGGTRVPNARSRSFADATNAAYQHYLDNNPAEPKFKVGDKVYDITEPEDTAIVTAVNGNAITVIWDFSGVKGTWYADEFEKLVEVAELERDKQFYKNMAYEKEKRIAELEFELAEWYAVGLKLAHKAPVDAHVNGGIKTIDILRAWLDIMSKSTETLAKPKFQVGDKVRVNGEIGESDYSEGQYDTIIEIGSGYKYAVRYADGGVESSLVWDENELLPYTQQSEGKQS